MSIIVDDLRDPRMHPLCEEAADEIERLETRIAELEARQVPEGRRTGDRLCELKTQDIVERDSYKHVGYILHREHRGFCLVNGAAVRWLTDDECWQLMHGDAAPSPADSGEVKPTDTERLNWIEDECRKHDCVHIDRNATELFSVTTQHIRAPSLRNLLDKAAGAGEVKP